ncbi:MAG: drug:proton antiporter [Porticoccaceae bacterium]|nr:drug:proton antiporter [Porticoccaceae bacterium]
MGDMVKVVFTPSGQRGTFPVGTPVLSAARELGVDIDSVCGGRGICGRCQIQCAEGTFPKFQITSCAKSLTPLCAAEIAYGKRKAPLGKGRRLSCHTSLLDDVVIDVPLESQVHKQVVRKSVEYRDIRLDPSIRFYYVQVPSLDEANPRGDLQLLMDALCDEWHLKDLVFHYKVLSTLQAKLSMQERGVTVAVYKHQRIIDLWSGLREEAYGVAVDLGSTTVAAHLCELFSGEVIATATMMNPQIQFGEDLMSRVSYAMMHPHGSAELTSVIREALNSLFVRVADEAKIVVEDILEVSVVSNPVMHHILLGISPVALGVAPFTLTTDESVNLLANDLGLSINSGGYIYILPCIAGHVGADTAGMLLSEASHEQDQMTLLVDIGTNAEIVLGNEQRLIACSSPTGPAFEGAQISCGQRAAVGAIERVRIDLDTLEPSFKVIGSGVWSDEDGFSNSLSNLGVTGICGSGIIEVIAEMYLAGIISEDGVIEGSLCSKTKRILRQGRTWSYLLYESTTSESRILITQNDVREIQLAKAALYAGVKLLMARMKVKNVDRVRLAGAFGSQIDVKRAMVLGLIPDCSLDSISSVGNAAGTGARIALLDQGARDIIERVVKTVDKLETAIEPMFQSYFVDALAFPNKTDSFPHLFSVLNRPKKRSGSPNGGDSGRARRRRRNRNL